MFAAADSEPLIFITQDGIRKYNNREISKCQYYCNVYRDLTILLSHDLTILLSHSYHMLKFTPAGLLRVGDSE